MTDIHRASAAQEVLDYVRCEEIVFYEYDEVVAFAEEQLARGPALATDARANLIAELLGSMAHDIARRYYEEVGYGRSELAPPDDD